jgi:hypothetical protein
MVGVGLMTEYGIRTEPLSVPIVVLRSLSSLLGCGGLFGDSKSRGDFDVKLPQFHSLGKWINPA